MFKIKVLVVDDSIVMRRIISDLLSKDEEIEVVGTARNGAEALDKVRQLDPDVVTMDIEMPVMDGITALQHIMAEAPRAVVMLSSMDKRQADITLKSLDLGAVDFIPKTAGSLSLDLEKDSEAILSKIKAAAKAKIAPRQMRTGPVQPTQMPTLSGDWIVLIGSSTGGPKALPEVLSRLPANLPAAVLVVQHMPEGFTRSFAERLNWISPLEVKEAEEGDEIRKGKIYLAQGNKHLVLRGNKLHLDDGPKVNYVRPAVDVLMNSVAPHFGPRTIGVVLTGMGSDGAAGMQLIKKNGGKTIVQNEETCVVYGMPKAVADLNAADRIVPLEDIAQAITIMISTGM
ncbi:MAG: chemotaxis response regulator protein-glutamate methylesterase [Methanomassiliicoccus sp.]|nr:chemotaxis response regulator protein-glutamate methylesterase [Methanomassiliicoccus sp.]